MFILARLIEVYYIKEVFFFEGSLAINANEEKMQTLISSLRKSSTPWTQFFYSDQLILHQIACKYKNILWFKRILKTGGTKFDVIEVFLVCTLS